MTLEFQEQTLKEQLAQLPPSARAAFAASCAERLVSVCQVFARTKRQTEQATLINDAREYVWGHILVRPEAEITDQLLNDLMEIIPTDEEPEWTDLTAYAQDGLSALAYCLRCLQANCDPQEAAWAARHLYEAVDQYAIDKHGSSPYEPGGESALINSEPVQAELKRQRQDLDDLGSARALPGEFLAFLRARSQAEQAITFEERQHGGEGRGGQA